MYQTNIPDSVPTVDIFAGAGGLGEGFSAYPDRASPFFRVTLSIEKNAAAARTLRLRALYRSFVPGNVPEVYYRFLRGQSVPDEIHRYLDGRMDLETLLQGFPDSNPVTAEHVWQVGLGEASFSEDELDARVERAIQGRRDWILIGGPPCQPFSMAGRSKQRAIAGYEIANDKRHTLYREYLRIIARHWPAVFVMENVKGILSARVNGEKVFERILEDLNNPAAVFGHRMKRSAERHWYHIWPLEESGSSRRIQHDLFGRHSEPDGYLIESENHGIPQARHRVILLGIRDDIGITPDTLKRRQRISVSTVLDGLPPLRSGIARTPDSRKQWRAISENTGQASSIGLTDEDRDDVTDSDAQWLAVLSAAKDSSWFSELEKEGGGDVVDVLQSVLSGLKPPAYGRGGDYVGSGSLPPHHVREPVLYEWLFDPILNGVCNHATREHMPEDHHRYLFAAAFASARATSPRLRDFPESLLPRHANVQKALKSDNFADRFRVQVRNTPSTTVMSHIAKDGHYFIHPDPAQARSLSVREAARIQTFPDNYYFCGNRSEQYVQVGNAVPPLLSWQIAEIVSRVLTSRTTKTEARAAGAALGL